MTLKTRRNIVKALSFTGGIVAAIGIRSVGIVTAKHLAPKSPLGQAAIFGAVYVTGLTAVLPGVERAIDIGYDWAYKDATMQEVHEVIVERSK